MENLILTLYKYTEAVEIVTKSPATTKFEPAEESSVFKTEVLAMGQYVVSELVTYEEIVNVGESSPIIESY